MDTNSSSTPEIKTTGITGTASEDIAARREAIRQRKEAKVPNVRPKDPNAVFDKKMLEENLGKMANQVSIFVKDCTDESKEYKFESADGQPEALKDVPSITFQNCSNCHFTISRRTKNIFIENCRVCTFEVNGLILTNSLEAWHGHDLKLMLNVQLKTLQIDMMNDVDITFSDWNNFSSIIFNQLNRLSLNFVNSPEHDSKTGYEQMLVEYPDSNLTDQFIVRFVNGAILSERCIRLRNGHLSTEREAIDWERRNERRKDDYKQKFLKEAGVHLNRSSEPTVRVGPNEPCICGSGKKYKKCCQGVKEVSGLATSEKKVTYRDR
jgi:hypothetical protein